MPAKTGVPPKRSGEAVIRGSGNGDILSSGWRDCNVQRLGRRGYQSQAPRSALARAFRPPALIDQLPPEPAPWLPVGVCFTRPSFFARLSITESFRRPSRESSPSFRAICPATAPRPSDAIALSMRGVVNRIGFFARRVWLLVRFVTIVVSVDVCHCEPVSELVISIRRFVQRACHLTSA